MIQLQENVNLLRYCDFKQNLQKILEPSYAQSSNQSLSLPESIFNPPVKSFSLSSTRSKGLSLSLKNKLLQKKSHQSQSTISNGECLLNSEFSKTKTKSILINTTHSIHCLGKSQSKIKQGQNKSINKTNNRNNFFINNSSNLCQSKILLNQDYLTPQKKNSGYTHAYQNSKIQVSVLTTAQKSKVEQKCVQKQGKANQLKSKCFIRSTNKSVPKSIPNLLTPNNKKPFIHTNNKKKTNHNNKLNELEIQSKKQFLQSYIEKPMINSIIVSTLVDHAYQEQPESPVLRLKKRLQLNSINCIYQRETFVSYQKSIRNQNIPIEESIIVNRNICQNFRPLTHKTNVFCQNQEQPYKLYLGQQTASNLIMTIKQLPVNQLQDFAHELLIYSQVQSSKILLKNILSLIKYSTDTCCHILIKQPFTQTLSDNLQTLVTKKITHQEFQNYCNSIIYIIKGLIELLAAQGIFLKRKFGLNDFVFVFNNVKVENLSLFRIGNSHQVPIQQAISEFQLQLHSYYNRISAGSMQF